MIGVFSGHNASRKIVIFGLAITNSQTVFSYSFIFKKFFEIMKTQPKVIITDQEKPLFYAIRTLQRQGIYKGIHLFDMFHMLRKFRRCSFEGESFQSLR